MASPEFSLFHLIESRYGNRLAQSRFSKATLIQLSHAMEGMITQQKSPVLVLVGFQNPEFWKEESARYERFSVHPAHLCIFAAAPFTLKSDSQMLPIALDQDDPLCEEWFLIIMGEQFSALLCGKESLAVVSPREFSTYITFEPAIIHQLLDALEQVITHYRPDKIEDWRQTRHHLPPTVPDMTLITQFILEISQYQENLNDHLRQVIYQYSDSEERFHSLTENLPDHIFIYNLPSRSLTYYNHALAFGYTPEKMFTFDQARQTMRPKDYEAVVARFRQASSEPYATAKILEYAMRTASGDWAWIRSNLIILTRDENGMAVDMMFIMTDITEQITSNEALRQSEERFREVAAAISHQIYMMDIRPDQDPEVLYVSSNVDQLTGYPAEKFLTIPRFWGKYVTYPEDIAILRSRYDQLMNGDPTLVEYRIVRADGKIRWIQDSARARPASTPGTWRVYGVLQDITDFKIIEEHLRQQQKLTLALEQERQLNTIKNSLMVTLSHEFRTPLSTILSASEMIERYGDKLSSEEYEARLRAIRQQVQHLTSMLDDISLIVKTEIGKIEFNATPINLFALFKEVVDEVRMGVGSRHHFVITNDDISIPVLVDIAIIKPVLMNLLVNAVKYSPEGSEVYCHITVTPYQARITIQDQGVGIPAEDLPHVFEPFHRGKNVVNITGTGLGLKIVKDFMELQQGLVKIDSIENEGTTVTLTLPVAT